MKTLQRAANPLRRYEYSYTAAQRPPEADEVLDSVTLPSTRSREHLLPEEGGEFSLQTYLENLQQIHVSIGSAYSISPVE